VHQAYQFSSAARAHFQTEKRCEKAFDIPLLRPTIRCVTHSMCIGCTLYPDQAKFSLFPGDSDSRHLIEYKEDRERLVQRGNDHRQSHRTLVQAVGVSEHDVYLLMAVHFPT
jgi:hypothetical protein